MGAKTALIVASLLGAGLILVGCSEPAGTPTDDAVRSDSGALPDAEILMGWAEALAKEELAQMAAAELIYRNKTYEFAMDGGEGMIQRAYCKYFRQFRSFEVEDIERTDSVLHPVKYTIRYDFDVLGTTPILGNPTGTEFLQRAQTDFFFRNEQSDSVVRVYESGSDSRPKSSYGPFLDRPNYWNYATTADMFGQIIWLREIPIGSG